MAARNSACCCQTPASAAALQTGETVRMAVQALAMPHCTSSHQPVTDSVGVACTRPNGAHGPGDLIEAADGRRRPDGTGELAISARLCCGDKKPAQPLASTAQGVDPSRSFVA
jgi:hypothetical protein